MISKYLRSSLATTATLLGITAGGLTALGGWLGSHNRWLEMASALRLQFAILTLPALAAAILSRHRIAIVTAAGAVVVTLAGIIPWHFGRDNPSLDGARLRVMSFNVLHGNRRFAETVDLVIREDPHVVAFHEASAPWPTELGNLTSRFPYRFSATELQIEIFSRLPIGEPEITVVGKMRGFVVLPIRLGARDVFVVATHAYPQRHFGQQGFEWRNRQLTELLPGAINARPDTPGVIMGDLNATMWSAQYKTLVRRAGLKNARRGFGIHPTCGYDFRWGGILAIPIDHCLVTRHWDVVDFRPGTDVGSDHLPIITDLALRP